MKRFLSSWIIVMVMLVTTPVLAAGEPTVLTLRNGDTIRELSLQDLRGMEVQTIETSTIWTDGIQVFNGVSLDHLMTVLGVEGTTLEASAINDYTVEIPLDSNTHRAAIVAFERNGREMSLRDKGPLWIIYPYDRDDEFRTEAVYSRSIWQLDRMTVK